MTKDTLMARLEFSQLEWAQHTHEGEDGLLIRCVCPQCEESDEKTHVAFSGLDELTWPKIESHVAGGRHVSHVTRVVGYYSKVENWNKSKRGELKDRQSGEYGVGEHVPDASGNGNHGRMHHV